jgi:hypothetical protein
MYKKGGVEVTEHITTGKTSKCHIMKTVSLATWCTSLVILNLHYIHAAPSAKINLSNIFNSISHKSASAESKLTFFYYINLYKCPWSILMRQKSCNKFIYSWI